MGNLVGLPHSSVVYGQPIHTYFSYNPFFHYKIQLIIQQFPTAGYKYKKQWIILGISIEMSLQIRRSTLTVEGRGAVVKLTVMGLRSLASRRPVGILICSLCARGEREFVFVQLTFNDHIHHAICGAAAFKIQVHRVRVAYLN